MKRETEKIYRVCVCVVGILSLWRQRKCRSMREILNFYKIGVSINLKYKINTNTIQFLHISILDRIHPRNIIMTFLIAASTYFVIVPSIIVILLISYTIHVTSWVIRKTNFIVVKVQHLVIKSHTLYSLLIVNEMVKKSWKIKWQSDMGIRAWMCTHPCRHGRYTIAALLFLSIFFGGGLYL